MEAADRARFEFVNGIVKAVETRKVFTRIEINRTECAVLTSKWIGIPVLPPSCSGYFTYHSLPSEHGLRTGWWAGLRRSRAGLQADRTGQSILAGAFSGRNHRRSRSGSRLPAFGNGYVFPDCAFRGLWLYGPRYGCSGSAF